MIKSSKPNQNECVCFVYSVFQPRHRLTVGKEAISMLLMPRGIKAAKQRELSMEDLPGFKHQILRTFEMNKIPWASTKPSMYNHQRNPPNNQTNQTIIDESMNPWWKTPPRFATISDIASMHLLWPRKLHRRSAGCQQVSRPLRPKGNGETETDKDGSKNLAS